MNILLTTKNKKTYRISSDSRQYILSEKKVVQKDTKMSKKGDIYYSEIAYISSLPSLFNRVLDLNIRESDVTSLSELKNLYKEVYEDLKQQFKEINND